VRELWSVLQNHHGHRAATQHGDIALVAKQLERDAVAVVRDHRVEGADAQGDRAHSGLG
jgi:hypothetical protein